MKGLLWLFPLVGGVLIVGYLQGFGLSPKLESGQAYRAALSSETTSSAVQTRAQTLGWWVRIQTGFEVTYFQGQERCESCESASEQQFFDLPQLVVDEGQFMVRLETALFRLNLRPNVNGDGGEELVLVMKQSAPQATVNAQLRDVLDPIGVALGNNLTFEPVPPAGKTTTPLPTGLRLDEVLYRLTQAPDWVEFANEQGLFLSGIRVRVVLELAGTQEPDLGLLVEQRAGAGLRAQALISQLVTLAQDPTVRRVRLSLQPQAGRN